MSSDAKLSKLKTEAIQKINQIVTNCKAKNNADISALCCELTKHLFSDHNVLYTDLNKYFESSDIAIILMKSITRFDDPTKRDILRLLYVMFQVNKSLREKAQKLDEFQAFLLEHLDQCKCWDNQIKYKHHINLASELLVDRVGSAFNTDSVRRLALRAIEANIAKGGRQDACDLSPCLVFYACAMYTETFEEIPTKIPGEPDSEKILTKEITGTCLDIIRDYINDFKMFYSADPELEKNQYVFYKSQMGFSFQQICSTITYYAVQSKELRMNLIQAGLFKLVNNLLSLVDVHETLLQCGIDLLKIPLIDAVQNFETDFIQSINSKLIQQLKRTALTEKTKTTLNSLLKNYDSNYVEDAKLKTENEAEPLCQTDERMLIHLTNLNMSSHRSSNELSFDKWGTLDVQQWLSENYLEDLKPVLSRLTGTGLGQLKVLSKEQTKMQIIDFLMDKMEINFEMCLEFLGALQKL